MNTNDLMSTLREADPAQRIDLARLGDDDFAGLRRGVLATGRPRASAAKRRRVRRSVVAGGLSLALIGGGAAAYASRDGWVRAQNPSLLCYASWADREADREEGGAPMIVDGPLFSDDPIADCQYYAKKSGVEPIADPVAIWEGTNIVVGPREGSPGGPSVGPRSVDAKALAEFENTLEDWVDGGNSECFTASTGKAFVTKELARLGLDDMKAEVETEAPEPVEGQEEVPGDEPGVCAFFFVALDDAGDIGNTVVVRPNFNPDYSQKGDPNDKDSLLTIRDNLRKQVADKCLSIGDAEKATKKVLGSEAEEGWPTSVTQDNTSDCTRVDMVVGGNTQIFLYGPKVAKP